MRKLFEITSESPNNQLGSTKWASGIPLKKQIDIAAQHKDQLLLVRNIAQYRTAGFVCPQCTLVVLWHISLTIRVTNVIKAAFSIFAWLQLTKICHRSGGCNDGSTKRMQVKTAASPSRSHSSNNYLTWLRLTIVCQNDRRLHWECPLLPVWRAFIHVLCADERRDSYQLRLQPTGEKWR